ncbi:MAG: peptidase M19, partial [Gemmatimonadetes bacterium]|nr:peptidase M19 [Gemmatimonadota bacterium]
KAAIDHIHHICELTGSTDHVAFGTDLDGGFGTEQAPRDLNTIADLPNLIPLLHEKGFSSQDVDGILAGNWLRLLREHWRDPA